VIVLAERLDSIFSIRKESFGLLMNYYLPNNKKENLKNKIIKNLMIQ
jgi:hypothetical protein